MSIYWEFNEPDLTFFMDLIYVLNLCLKSSFQHTWAMFFLLYCMFMNTLTSSHSGVDYLLC